MSSWPLGFVLFFPVRLKVPRGRDVTDEISGSYPWVSLDVNSKVRARAMCSGSFRPEYELYLVLLFFLSLVGPGRSHTLLCLISWFSEGDGSQLHCASLNPSSAVMTGVAFGAGTTPLLLSVAGCSLPDSRDCPTCCSGRLTSLP